MALELSRRGYRDVRVLAGGFDQWRLAGYPVERKVAYGGAGR